MEWTLPGVGDKGGPISEMGILLAYCTQKGTFSNGAENLEQTGPASGIGSRLAIGKKSDAALCVA